MIANETTLHKRPNYKELTTIGHHTDFNNKQRLYCIDSYKRPRNDNVKQFKWEN